MTTPEELFDQCIKILSQRGAVYSPDSDKPAHFQRVADIFTALIEEHYGLKLPHPLPGWMAANLNSATKLIRGSRDTAQLDTFLDLANYSFLALNSLESDREKALKKFAEAPYAKSRQETYDWFKRIEEQEAPRTATRGTVFEKIDELIFHYGAAKESSPPGVVTSSKFCEGAIEALKKLKATLSVKKASDND